MPSKFYRMGAIFWKGRSANGLIAQKGSPKPKASAGKITIFANASGLAVAARSRSFLQREILRQLLVADRIRRLRGSKLLRLHLGDDAVRHFRFAAIVGVLLFGAFARRDQIETDHRLARHWNGE